MSDEEISPTKRKAVAVIPSSDDSSNFDREEKDEYNNSSSSCQENISKNAGGTIEKQKKTPKRIKKNIIEDSSCDSEHETSTLTPSKLQMQRKRMEKLCRQKKSKAIRIRRARQCRSSSEVSNNENIQTESIRSLRKDDKQHLVAVSDEENSSDSDVSSDSDNYFVNDEQSIMSYSNSESEIEQVIKNNPSQLYANPYMERNDDLERKDIMKVLSKSTEKDIDNRERYVEEIGKYQLQIHSDTNPALYLTEGKRYNRIMKETRHDEAFKEERNIGKWDCEYYDNYILKIRGSKVQIFPHTRVVAKYSFKCDLSNCNDKFFVGETSIVGMKKYSKSHRKFINKQRINSSKESFYWICASHCPSRVWNEESCSSYSSDDEF